MRCPICVAAGTPHTLTITNQRPKDEYACTEFWDSDDRFHTHDRQVRQVHLHCSNNHNFMISHLSRCPHMACEWNKQPMVNGGTGWPEVEKPKGDSDGGQQ